MSEILPQEDIDALLLAVTEGEEDSGAGEDPSVGTTGDDVCRMYDLRRPMFLSSRTGDLLRQYTLSLCEEAEASLGPSAGMSFRRESITVDQISYGEYIASLNSPALFTVHQIDPLPGLMAIEMMPTLAYALIDVLAGREIRDLSLNTGFTPGEAREAVKPVTLIADALCRSFAPDLTLQSRMKALYTNPLEAALCPDGEMGVLLVLEASLDVAEGIITLFLPRPLIVPLMGALAGDKGDPPRDSSPALSIYFPLKARHASLAQIQGLTEGGKLEIDPQEGIVR